MNLNDLSKTISHALRHAPQEYGLNLDDEGWVEIIFLLNSLKERKEEWQSLSIDTLYDIINLSDKKRHEIEGSYIRAIYGHSVEGKFNHNEAVPPQVLYHGTSRESVKNILYEGIKPLSRQYVHLSQIEKEAYRVGKRKDAHPSIFYVDADKAYREGVKFYIGNDKIWLVDYVSPKYLSILK